MNLKLTKDQLALLRDMEVEGRLYATEVLAEAKRPGSILNDLYDWDQETAAEKWWLERTREIIREVRVNIVTTSYTVEAVRYVPNPDRKPGYVTMDMLRSDRTLSEEAVVAECTRALGSLRRAANIAAAVEIESPLGVLVAQLERYRAQLTGNTLGAVAAVA